MTLQSLALEKTALEPSLQYQLSGEGRDVSALAGLGRGYMEIRTLHGLTHIGSWKPSHHGADKDLILHCKGSKPKIPNSA